MIYTFDRYRDGVLMAEGIQITKAKDEAGAFLLAEAMISRDECVKLVMTEAIK